MQAGLNGQGSDTDDDNVSVITKTDDDLVGDAVRQVLVAFENEDDDYEEILFDPTYVSYSSAKFLRVHGVLSDPFGHLSKVPAQLGVS